MHEWPSLSYTPKAKLQGGQAAKREGTFSALIYLNAYFW